MDINVFISYYFSINKLLIFRYLNSKTDKMVKQLKIFVVLKIKNVHKLNFLFDLN